MDKLVFALLCLVAVLCFAAAWGLLHAPIEAGFLFLGGVGFAIEASRRVP